MAEIFDDTDVWLYACIQEAAPEWMTEYGPEVIQSAATVPSTVRNGRQGWSVTAAGQSRKESWDIIAGLSMAERERDIWRTSYFSDSPSEI